MKVKCFVQRDAHCKIRSWQSSMRWPRALSHSPSGLGGVASCSYCKGAPTTRFLPSTWHLSPSYKDPNLMLYGPWNLPRALHTEPVAASSAALLLTGHYALPSFSFFCVPPPSGWIGPEFTRTQYRTISQVNSCTFRISWMNCLFLLNQILLKQTENINT